MDGITETGITEEAGGSGTEVNEITDDLAFSAGNTDYDLSTPEGREAVKRDMNAQVKGLSKQGQEIGFLKAQVTDLQAQVKGGQEVREEMEHTGGFSEDDIQKEIRERGFVTKDEAEKRAAEIASDMIKSTKAVDALNDVLDECKADTQGHPGFDDKAVLARLKEMGIEHYEQLGTTKTVVKRRVELAYKDLMEEAGTRKSKEEETRPRSRVFQERPSVGTSRLKPPPVKRPGLDDDGFSSFLAEQLPERD